MQSVARLQRFPWSGVRHEILAKGRLTPVSVHESGYTVGSTPANMPASKGRFLIHPTAIVAKTAKLGEGVSIGPYTVVEDQVEIGDRCRIGPRVHLSGWTTLGSDVEVHAGAVIGDSPQDHGYQGEQSYCRIGSHTVIREYVTIHRAVGAEAVTQVGDHCMLMGFVHVGHNSVVGNHCNIANNTVLGGHVTVEDHVNLSVHIGVHQFVRIGTLVMVGSFTRITRDIPPYCLVAEGSSVRGANSVGMKRAGLSLSARSAVKGSIKSYFFEERSSQSALEDIVARFGETDEVRHFVSFIKGSKRGIASRRKPRAN